jgi:two-component system response regulator FixJ
MTNAEGRAAIVTIIDDNEGARLSLRALLESVGFQVVIYVSGTVFLKDIFPPLSDCMIVDMRMPGLNGLELQEELIRRGSTTPLIMVTGHGDVPLAVTAIRAGAFDFFEKPYDDDALLASVRRAVDQTGEARKLRVEAEAAKELLARLSARERDVLDGLALGQSNKIIAHLLGISPRTVEAHRARLVEKMDGRNLADLVQLLRTAGMS